MINQLINGPHKAARAGKGEVTSQQHHSGSGQQTLHHEATQ